MQLQNTIVQISSRPTIIQPYTHSSMEYLQSRECLRVGTLEKKIRQPGSHCSGAKRPTPRAVGKAVERQELLNWLIIWLDNIGRAGSAAAAAALIEAHTFCRTDERISYCCYFIQFMSIDKFINFLCCSKCAHPQEGRKQILTQDRTG